jgi:DNA sulfur modification protein DndE
MQKLCALCASAVKNPEIIVHRPLNMQLSRIRFCEEADQRLRQLKARTSLSANLLCRIGFNLSLAEPSIPDPARYPEDSRREIERGTLTGRYDELFVALLRQRCLGDGLPGNGPDFEAQFHAHMNRGVLLLYQQVKALPDLCKLAQHRSRA